MNTNRIENVKIIYLTKDEFDYVIFTREYMECCRGSYEPTELILSPASHEFLSNKIPQFTNRLMNAEVSIAYDVCNGWVALTVDINKLNEQQIEHKLARNKRYATSCLFVITDL